MPYVTDARFRAAYRRAQARSGDSRPGVKTQAALHGRKFNFQCQREPARASPTKNEEPQRRHTTALMARPPHGGHAHRDAAAKPPCAAKRTQAHIAPAATAAPAESPALGGPECPQGELGPRARTSSARPTRDPPAARPRSAGPAGTGSSRARPKNRPKLVTPCHDKHSGSRKGEITYNSERRAPTGHAARAPRAAVAQRRKRGGGRGGRQQQRRQRRVPERREGRRRHRRRRRQRDGAGIPDGASGGSGGEEEDGASTGHATRAPRAAATQRREHGGGRGGRQQQRRRQRERERREGRRHRRRRQRRRDPGRRERRRRRE